MDALTYQIKLVDLMSGPASKADAAVNKLAAALKKTADIEKSLGKEQAQAAKLYFKQIEQEEKQTAKLQQQAAKTALAEQKKADSAALKEAKKYQAQYKAAQKAADSGGALDALKDKVLALVGPEELAAAAAAGLAAAFGVVVIGGASLAIQAAEAKQDTLDLLDAMLGSQAAAKDVYGRIEDLTGKVAISQERGTELARQLSAAGVTSADALTDAIKAIGQVESVLGNEAGGKIQTILEKAAQSGKFTLNPKQLVGTGVQVQKLYEQIAKNTGKGVKQVEAELKAGKISAEVGVKALTQVVGQKFAGPAEGQVRDLGNQLQHLKDNIGRLFEDVDTSKFLDALHDLLSVFDQSTDSGKALKAVVTSFFDGVFSVASAVLPYIKVALKGIVIIGLQIGIALRPLIKQLKQAFGGDSKGSLDSFASALSTIGDAIGSVVAWFVELATNTNFLTEVKVVLVAIGIAIGLVAAPLILVTGLFWGMVAAIGVVLAYGAELVGWAINAGGSIVSGLIEGISNAAGQLYESVAGIGAEALKRFKKVFGIASPSKVMMGVGKNLMAGLDMGIDLNAKPANDTLAASVEPPPVLSSRGSAATTVTHNAGGVTINITINGVGSTAELKEMMPEIMADALEQAGLMTGAPQAA